MRKVKIMLVSLALIAVVGASLALKSKRAYVFDNYCSAAPVGGNCTQCQAVDPAQAFDPPNPNFACYTTSDDIRECNVQSCPFKGTHD